MIVILDYEMGNVGSIQNMLRKIGVREVTISRDAGDIRRADRLILPGVGAFDAGMERLREFGLPDLIREHALERGKPLLGICLGMQLLFERSEESVGVEGLSILPGEILKIPPCEGLKIPHMGWNDLTVLNPCAMTENMPKGAYVYFVHSFRADTGDENISCYTIYNERIPALVHRGYVYGAQFHPEKSGAAGLELLKNFARLVRK